MAAKKKPSTVDFEKVSADKKKNVKPADLQQVKDAAEEMRGIISRLAKYQEVAAELTERYNQLQLETLPQLMLQAGMQEFTLVTGETVTVRDFVRASIPTQASIDEAEGPDKAVLEDRRKKCFDWLKKNKAESLIKSKLTAEFGKGQGKAAIEFKKLIQKKGYASKLDQSVHPQTLNKFIRETIKEGKDVPFEPFALFVGKKAEISKPSPKQ